MTRDVYVTCPNCGAVVTTQAKVSSIRVDDSQLLVAYHNQFVDHACGDS